VLTRHRGSRAPTLVVAAILAAVIIAGCRAEPVDESGLDDIEDSDPVEAEEPEPDPQDDASEDEGADEPEGDASAEALDEPDGDGGLIPESAFEINDDLDLDAEAQSAILARYARGVRLVEALFAGENVSETDLREYYSEEELAKVYASAERMQTQGRVQLALGSTATFVRLVDYGGGTAIVHRCQVHGADAGVYDIETGERLASPPPGDQLLVAVMALEIEEEQPARWVQVDGGVENDAECS
jgi:hypothetical protein